MKNLILIVSLILFVSCSNKQKEEEILFDEAVTMFKEHANIDSLSKEAITKLNIILSQFPDSKLTKSIESGEKKFFVNDHGFLTYYEILELDKDLIKNKKAQILFDEACGLLSNSTNEDSISAKAVLKIKTILIDYPKTKLAKSLELNVQKILLYNSEPLTFSELVKLDDKLISTKKANKLEITGTLMNLAASSKAYYKTPKTHGGGGKSFKGLINGWIPKHQLSSDNSYIKTKYSVVKMEDSYVIFQGESKFWKVQMKVTCDDIELISIKRNK
jgi:hypothetical protein